MNTYFQRFLRFAGSVPRRSALPALLALLLGGGAHGIAAEPGVVAVMADAEQIGLTLQGGASELEVVELGPHQFARDGASAPVLVRIEPGHESKISTPRFSDGRDRLYDGFMARVPGGETVGPLRYVDELRGVSKNADPIPTAASRKGLQVQMTDDAIALGVKHAAINVDLASLIDPAGVPDSLAWPMDGSVFHFRRPLVERNDKNISALSRAGAQVTLILLNYKSRDPAVTAIMKPPQAGSGSSSPIWGFNVGEPGGAAWYRAAIEFLADRYSGADAGHGRVVGYIIGNEVDSHSSWYDIGDAPLDGLVENYERAVRLANLAIRKASAQARVFLSMDHLWFAPTAAKNLHAVPARALLDAFALRARAEGDFDWHLAFHPYPADLREPRTWRDRVGSDFDTAIISPRNLELLPAYLRRPELIYRGQPRRIILSEQGFNTPTTEDGERWQAAGFCYTWVKLSHLEGIDAFILHRHVDHAKEDGLRLGLWTRRPDSMASPERKKLIYDAFQACDTPNWKAAFAPFLVDIGIASWDEVK